MPSRLDTIVETKRREVLSLRRQGIRTFSASGGPRRDFAGSLSRPGTGVIAEIKRRSPSRGAIRSALNPGEIAATYEHHGACAISVLTDGRFFGGSLEDLDAARRATGLPVLRKDFILTEIQLEETAAAGADAVLLIVAVVGTRLGKLLRHSRSCGLDALVEVHDRDELQRAVAEGAELIGVNNRDLTSFEVDPQTSGRLRPLIPAHCVAVAESGIATRADVLRIERQGYDACLIGEALMTAGDPGAALVALSGSEPVESVR